MYIYVCKINVYIYIYISVETSVFGTVAQEDLN